MEYDRATGDVTILEKSRGPRRAVIKNTDDLKREKEALKAELGIDDEAIAAGNVDKETAAEQLAKYSKILNEEYDVDPSKFYVFSRDFFRIDVGLMIARPPIFMHMREIDNEWNKMRSRVMNEYHSNQKSLVSEFDELSKMNESMYAQNSYASESNLDNFPTHEYTDPQTGETHLYCAASKNYTNVDPACPDWRTLHYAPEDRTYLLLRNKHTKEWEFPTAPMYFGQTFLKAKQSLFADISSSTWKVIYVGNMPQLHTLRPFTVAEKEEDEDNHALKGVRTYFFHANHYRGMALAENFGHIPYDDVAWVPKRKMNEFMTKEYHKVFIDSLTTR